MERQVISPVSEPVVLETASLGETEIFNVTRESCLQDKRQVFYVRTTEELRELTKCLLGKTLLLRVNALHTDFSTKDAVERLSSWEESLIVLVNPRNPPVRNALSEALLEAAHYLARGQKFCLEVDVSDAVYSWCQEKMLPLATCDEFSSTRAHDARFFVTNHGVYKHCFNCNIHWCLFFSICWLMAAPCYFLYRRITCQDFHINLSGQITILSLHPTQSSQLEMCTNERI